MGDPDLVFSRNYIFVQAGIFHESIPHFENFKVSKSSQRKEGSRIEFTRDQSQDFDDFCPKFNRCNLHKKDWRDEQINSHPFHN